MFNGELEDECSDVLFPVANEYFIVFLCVFFFVLQKFGFTGNLCRNTFPPGGRNASYIVLCTTQYTGIYVAALQEHFHLFKL